MKICLAKSDYLVQKLPKNDGQFGSIKEQVDAYEDYEYAKFLKAASGNDLDGLTDFKLRESALTKIAKLSGTSASEVNNVVNSWTTGSDTAESLKLQKAASELFNVIQNDHFNHIAGPVKPDSCHYKIASAIYRLTQDLLEAHNIKKILLYRGFNIPKIDDSLVSKLMPTTLNPLSSFSNAYNVAFKFTHQSNWFFKKSNFPYVTVASFNADRIFSTSLTGTGM